MINSLLKLKNDIISEASQDVVREIDAMVEYAALKAFASKSKIIYSAAFLTNEGRNNLKDWWESNVRDPILPKLFAHHLTIKFKPSYDEVIALDIGKDVLLEVIGYISNDDLQAVVISSEVSTSNEVPHITVSTNEGVSPAKSNDMLRDGFIEVKGPNLKARIGYWNGKEAIYEYPED